MQGDQTYTWICEIDVSARSVVDMRCSLSLGILYTGALASATRSTDNTRRIRIVKDIWLGGRILHHIVI
jgi:hypothetical protein